MPSVANGLREVAGIVADHGFPVTFVRGWETRGRGTLYPQGMICHWTAGGSHDTASLNLVIDGSSRGLPNALSNTYSSRSARLYIVAAGIAWHGGRGAWRGVTGNSRWLGHEAENSGRGDWTPEHLALYDVHVAACREVFDLPLPMVCDHFEYANPPGRKVDCNDIGGSRRRARLATLDLAAPPEPEPEPEPDPEVFAMPLVIFKMTGTDGFYVLNNLTGQIYPITTPERLDLEERRLRQPGPHPEISATEARHYWTGQPLDPPQPNKPPVWSY